MCNTGFDGGKTGFGMFFDTSTIVVDGIRPFDDCSAYKRAVWDILARATEPLAFTEADDLIEHVKRLGLVLNKKTVLLGLGDTITVRTNIGDFVYTEKTNQNAVLNFS